MNRYIVSKSKKSETKTNILFNSEKKKIFRLIPKRKIFCLNCMYTRFQTVDCTDSSYQNLMRTFLCEHNSCPFVQKQFSVDTKPVMWRNYVFVNDHVVYSSENFLHNNSQKNNTTSCVLCLYKLVRTTHSLHMRFTSLMQLNSLLRNSDYLIPINFFLIISKISILKLIISRKKIEFPFKISVQIYPNQLYLLFLATGFIVNYNKIHQKQLILIRQNSK